ncbi:MAG: peptide-methionine (S)-S-oxide reductase [Candidatus Dadabacteria bacterium]|nr:peptide-methionine (S)-S-oxide reductase [Candidatus Dadabacteria bacterium]NIV41410.1 hypothetical protein [Candidatus Dadabacteria bacterium]
MKFLITLVFILSAMLLVLKDMTEIYAVNAEVAEHKYSDDFKPNLNNPAELGYVNWHRNFGKAVELAKREDKPILLFFNEVPGCNTASGYGKNVMRHPLIIEAAETLFIPVAIYNNVGGHDREVLDSFGEPTWNNPVVRFIDSDRKQLTPRLAGDYTKLGLVRSMIKALKSDSKPVPDYLNLLEKELSAERAGKEKAIFSMYCFWSGEGSLGNIDGVVSTKAGFMGGKEVVQVEYNPRIISYDKLLRAADKGGKADHVFAANEDQKRIAKKLIGKDRVSNEKSFMLDREPKYYMSKTHYKYVPMTPLQASLVNSAVGKRQSPHKYLSQRQLGILNSIKNNPELNWKDHRASDDFIAEWNYTIGKLDTVVSKK